MNRNSASGFVIGLACGLGLGLFSTSRYWRTTRSLIEAKAGEGANYLRRQAAHLRDTATDAIEKSSDEVARHKAGLMRAIETGKAAYQRSVSEG